MFSDIWDFLRDGTNRSVLGWIGGGIATVAAGIWAVVKAKNSENKQLNPRVSADRGSMAAGRDISINPRGPSKR
jgi:hypothetical protein